MPLAAKKSGLNGINTTSQHINTLYDRTVKEGGQSKSA